MFRAVCPPTPVNNNKDMSHCIDTLDLIEADLMNAVTGITTMISGNERDYTQWEIYKVVPVY